MTKTDCEQTIWYDQGVRDGMAGVRGFKASDYVSECKSKYNVDGSKEEYDKGYQVGITSFCSEKQAIQKGLRNYYYDYNACSLEVRHIVMEAYFNSRISNYENQRRKSKDNLQQIMFKLNTIEREIRKEKIPDGNLLNEISEMKKLLNK